jgi:WD40 repeat protein
MASKAKNLELHAVIGFGGQVPAGLHYHPNKTHLIYSLGSTLVIKKIGSSSDKSVFLQEHNGPITCISVSKSGKYIASGQSTHMGFKADIIIWDFEEKKMMHRMTLHKVKVQSLCFSHDEKYLVSIGGQDDNNLTIWDVQTGKAICGALSPNLGLVVSFFNNRNDMIVAAGKYLLKVWQIDYNNRKLIPEDCRLGQMKRIFTCLVLDQDDSHAYCGSTSGDILCVQMKGPKNFKYAGPKRKISQGILSIAPTKDGEHLIVGGGDGTLALLDKDSLSTKKRIQLTGAVMSISLSANGQIYVGTAESVIYIVEPNFTAKIISTCHKTRINDIVYPRGTHEIFATCSVNDIRIWNAVTCTELVRIQVPNLECNCVCFTPDGSAIVSGWSDGRIRAFGPETGRLLYVINDAHRVIGQKSLSGALSGVTALAVSNDNTKLISGGSDGQVRVWQINRESQVLIGSMKQHKATINCICLKKDNSECVSACDDGSCIVWNLDRFVRENIMYAQTYFKQCCYLPDESQILTTGSDKIITYWDAYDCSAIRELDGSENGELHALDIAPNGEYFASGGQDRLVTVWHYDQGEPYAIGYGHSGNITKIKFSPDGKFITSVGDEGAILIWKTDFE